jgi:hypothetical protein
MHRVDCRQSVARELSRTEHIPIQVDGDSITTTSACTAGSCARHLTGPRLRPANACSRALLPGATTVPEVTSTNERGTRRP